MGKVYTLDCTLDRVIMLTLDLPNLTVGDWKEIAARVTGMTDRATKDAKIRELAAAMSVEHNESLAGKV